MYGDFVCVAEVAMNEWSEEVAARLIQTIGRNHNEMSGANGVITYVWFCSCLSSAVLMAEAARQIPGVTAEGRER